MNGDLNTVYKYHNDTKHHFKRHARSLGFMDWSNQPDPFLRFPAVETTSLPRDDSPGATWIEALTASPTAVPVEMDSLGRLLYTSMALSAWKEVADPGGEVVSRWSLRVNPSSGNLHPTEAWMVTDRGLSHYRPDLHALEAVRPGPGWPARRGILLGLSSIAWREAWKYGERAFRYCNHDVGHALAAVTLAAGALGWRVRALEHLPTPLLNTLLGCDGREGPEADHADLLLHVGPAAALGDVPDPDEISALIAGLAPCGPPNPLSGTHHPWPIIEDVREAVVWPGGEIGPLPGTIPGVSGGPDFSTLVRGRRSAVAMDGETSLSAADFFAICRLLSPKDTPLPHGVLSGQPQVAPVFFVHRVDDLAPGLYVFPRDDAQEAELRQALRQDFEWVRPDHAPQDLPLFRLAGGDLCDHARSLCCHQDIAGDGAFAVAMLARFEEPLQRHGAGFYPRLFWETGVLGQLLYLGADVAGVQGTGIGCFYDDPTHEMLGLEDQAWQSLYHFTVGGGVSDSRLRTAEAYPG